MINVIIIEDEMPALEVLTRVICEASDEVIIKAKLTSVQQSIDYFKNSISPADIIFSDVQLADGLSFEIFKHAAVKTPVIFTTCYDKFMLLAFENNGIDYILKPVEKKDIVKGLSKYKNLQNHFEQQVQDKSMEKLMSFVAGRSKSRVLVKRGMEHILLRLEDIILFYTESKMVYVIDRFSKKYILDKTLSELEEELDERLFFRANRQYIVNLDYVKGFKPVEKVKLLIDLNVPEISHSIIVSQETAQAFRKWIRNG